MVRDEALTGDVVLVEADVRLADVERTERLAEGQPLQITARPTSITKQPPGLEMAATFWKHATCSSCVVRFLIVLKTR